MLLRRNEERIGRPHFYFADTTTMSDLGEGLGKDGRPSSPYTGAEGMGPARTTTTTSAAQNTRTFSAPTGSGTTTTGPSGASATGATATTAQEAARANAAAAAAAARARDAAKANNPNSDSPSLADRARALNETVSEAGQNALRNAFPSRNFMSQEAVAAGDKAYTEARALGLTEEQAQTMARDAARDAEKAARGYNPEEPAGLFDVLNQVKTARFTAENTGPTYNPAETARANDTTNGYTKTEPAIRAAIDNPSTATETGAEVMEEVIKEAVKDAKNEVEAASKVANHNTGSAINILEKLSGGNISKPAARAFQIGEQMTMARMGYATIEPFERAQLNTIEEFTQQLDMIGADVQATEMFMEMGKNTNENIIYNALIAIETELGLTEDEMKRLGEDVTVFNNDEASVEDREKAFDDIMKVLLDKISAKDQNTLASTIKMLIGMFAKQANEHCGKRKNEGAIAKDILGKLKQGVRNGTVSREVFDEFETEYEQQEAERKAEEKGEVELANKIEHFIIQLEKLLNADGRRLVPDWMFALQFATRARLNALSKGWHLGSFLLKMVINFIALPFCPIMAIKGILSAIKGMTSMDNDLTNAFSDPSMSLVDYSNDESIKALAAEIVANNTAVLNAGDKMRNKAIKGIVLAVLSLFIGNIGLFAIGLVNALIYVARVQIIKTDLKWYLDNIDNVNRTLDKINSDAPEMKMNALGKIKQPTGELCRRETEYTYSNEYQNEWITGGNTNTEEIGGWNQGIASDEEVAEYIRQNFNRDASVRRMAGGLN